LPRSLTLSTARARPPSPRCSSIQPATPPRRPARHSASALALVRLVVARPPPPRPVHRHGTYKWLQEPFVCSDAERLGTWSGASCCLSSLLISLSRVGAVVGERGLLSLSRGAAEGRGSVRGCGLVAEAAEREHGPGLWARDDPRRASLTGSASAVGGSASVTRCALSKLLEGLEGTALRALGAQRWARSRRMGSSSAETRARRRRAGSSAASHAAAGPQDTSASEGAFVEARQGEQHPVVPPWCPLPAQTWTSSRDPRSSGRILDAVRYWLRLRAGFERNRAAWRPRSDW